MNLIVRFLLFLASLPFLILIACLLLVTSLYLAGDFVLFAVRMIMHW